MNMWDAIDAAIARMTATATSREVCERCGATIYGYDNEEPKCDCQKEGGAR